MSHVALDLTKRHFVHPYIGKGITVYGTWWRGDDGRHRPCIVLLPTNRRINQRVRPCVVTVDDAFKWDVEAKGLNKEQREACERYISNAGAVFAEQLGIGVGPHSASTVINVIHDELDDLMKIPPLPPGDLIVVADGFVTDENGKTKHREIVERV